MADNGERFQLEQTRQTRVAHRLTCSAHLPTLPLAHEVSPSTLQPVRNPKEHTPAEWEELRPHFTELYLHERKRLADVSRILREERGFHATDKQYKDRIRKWGVRKNFKDGEKREALITGIDTQNGDHVAIDGVAIPRHRLKRFARDAKLFYIRRMAAGAILPPEPEADFDIIIELPRSSFASAHLSDAGTLHAAFAAIDRLSKARWPVMAFEVLGVSDACVRYGLRRLERKAVPGMAFEMLPASEKPGEEQGPGVRFCTSIQALQSNYEASEEEQSHMVTFHTITLRLYEACQNVYLRRSHAINAVTSLEGQPPEFYCTRFNGSPLAAQRLYLRALAESSMAGGLRYADPSADAELISSPAVGAAFRFGLGPQRDMIFAHTQSLNVAMHAAKKGDIVAGVFRFQPGFEGVSISVAGRFEQEATRLRTMLAQAPGADFIRTMAAGLQGANEPFLTDGDNPEKEFMEVSQRAASRTVGPARRDPSVSYALVTNPITEADALSGPLRIWAKLLSTGCLVDREEPWKMAWRPQPMR